MENNTKLLIGLMIGIAILMAFISSCEFHSNVRHECKRLAQIHEPDNMHKQQQAYEAELWSYYYMRDLPNSELKKIIVEFYSGRNLSYIKQAMEYDLQMKAFNGMKDIENSELKERMIKKYPNDYCEQFINYHNQLEAKNFINGIEEIFQMTIEDRYPIES